MEGPPVRVNDTLTKAEQGMRFGSQNAARSPRETYPERDTLVHDRVNEALT